MHTPRSAQAPQRWNVIAPFLVVVALLGGLGLAAADVLSAARAYVGGESLWSKGQKDAVYHLGRYVASSDEEDWQAFRRALAVPLGDRVARLELNRPDPDLARVRAGFIAGGNEPEDIPGMVRLYRHFGRIDFMAEAIAIWAEGDTGIAELERIGERLHALVSSSRGDRPELREALAELVPLNERLTQLEQRFSGKLGEASRTARRLVEAGTVALALLLAGIGIWLTSRILSRQEAAERALRLSHSRWEMAGKAAGIGVFEWDVAGRRIALDVRAAALYGIALASPGVVETERTRAAIHPDDLERLRERVRQAVSDGTALQARFRVRLADGAVRHLEMSAQGAPGDRDRTPRLVGILWDVTDDVRAEQLQLDKEAAERANRAKTEFLSRVSHELRTPLNAILGFTQLMQVDAQEPLSRGQAQRVEHVLASGQQLLGLINDVLDLSSIDQGALALVPREFDAAASMREVLARFEPLAAAHKVSLALVAPPEALGVRLDPLRVEQVVGNLLSNAIKYNRPGGHVELRLERDAAGDAALFALHVSDEGQGMTPTRLAQLFQPFNRLGAEFSRVQGSGLGLVIARALVERMGGTIEVKSQPGFGSTFSVRLPRGAVASGSSAPAVSADAAADAAATPQPPAVAPRQPRGTASSSARV